MTRPSVPSKFEKVLVISKADTSKVETILTENNFRVVQRNPDFIVSYGGDGTVLFCEREFPQIPKLLVKKGNICRKCDYTMKHMEDLLRKIREGKFRLQEEMKLETEFHNRKLVALNEIQIHNKLPIQAIRFSLFVEGREFNDLIGDGAIIATPFGSTGYYKSTGGKPFTEGIGISFNNLHNKTIKSFVVSTNSIINVKVNRGPAWVTADNNPEYFELKNYDTFSIRESGSKANFIYILE